MNNSWPNILQGLGGGRGITDTDKHRSFARFVAMATEAPGRHHRRAITPRWPHRLRCRMSTGENTFCIHLAVATSERSQKRHIRSKEGHALQSVSAFTITVHDAHPLINPLAKFRGFFWTFPFPKAVWSLESFQSIRGMSFLKGISQQKGTKEFPKVFDGSWNTVCCYWQLDFPTERVKVAALKEQ